MGITELISKIGDENIQIQNLQGNITDVKNPKHNRYSSITFTTSPDHGQEMSAALMASQPARRMAMVLWFDLDKVPEEVRPKAKVSE